MALLASLIPYLYASRDEEGFRLANPRDCLRRGRRDTQSPCLGKENVNVSFSVCSAVGNVAKELLLFPERMVSLFVSLNKM